MVTGCLRTALLGNIQLLLQRSVVFEGLSVMFLIRSIVFALCSKVLVVSFRWGLKCEVSLWHA
jgi:hypothetical protein